MAAGSLFSGQSISPHLPWFQGDPDNMEQEALALCLCVRNILADSPITITLDLHSGFGTRDRIWFPYAYTQQSYSALPETYALKRLFDITYPHHVYRIEPISKHYIIDGDLWDYLYLEYSKQHNPGEKIFLPLTLEMGSWHWLRKNPRHIFNRHGFFHPVLPHRRQRILRRHLILFDFLHRSLLNPVAWAKLNSSLRQKYHQEAKNLWYAQR
jgi:hypothetical protein